MERAMEIQDGMAVYSENGQQIGTVERSHGGGFDVKGRHYGPDSVVRVAERRVYVRGTATAEGQARTMTDQTEGEMRIPVVEERLSVGKREAEQGEVQVRKTVTEEQQTVPVTLRREEVRVEERDTDDRPLQVGEVAFNEGTLRVPVRGEEAVVSKEAVVTGEVVIGREATTETQQVTDTVRREYVDVDEHYRQARADFEQEFQGRARGTQRTFAQAEPNYRAGFTAARDARHDGRAFEDAEPELRREYETSATGANGDRWEQLREEVRSGWDRARQG